MAGKITSRTGTIGGTKEQALKNAETWVKMHIEGPLRIYGLQISGGEKQPDSDNYRFEIKHPVTGKVITLDIHGYTAAEVASKVWVSNTWYNDHPTNRPDISDWAMPGFSARVVFIKSPGE